MILAIRTSNKKNLVSSMCHASCILGVSVTNATSVMQIAGLDLDRFVAPTQTDL